MSTGPVERTSGRTALIWAWVCVGLIPVAFVVASLVGGWLLALAGVDEGSPEVPPASVVLPVGLVSIAVMIAPAIAALVLGIRAARRGRPSGIAAAVIGGLVAVGGVVFNLFGFVVGSLLG